MAAGGGATTSSQLDEDAHVFDFADFYKREEFCDRTVLLEILKEGGAGITVYGAGADFADPAGEAPGAPKREAGTQTGGPTCLERFNVLTHWLRSSSPLILTRSPGAPPQTLGALFPSPPAPQHHLPKPLLSSLRALGMSPVRTTPAHYLMPPMGLLDSLGLQSDEEAEEIPVSSVLLAAKSCVLRTMLSNGMRESDRGAPVVFKVTREEKAAFKEMLRFIYSGTLSQPFRHPEASVHALVNLLIVGDKFEVGSFMGAVLRALSDRERTVADSVVLALEVPDVLEQHPRVKRVVEEARAFLVATFKDVAKWGKSLQFLKLGQDVVNFLLQAEELEAASEEEVFLNVLVWVKNNFDGLAERQEAMAGFSQHIRFGCMRGEFLVESVLGSPEMALPACQELVRGGIYFQAFSDDKKQRVTEAIHTERKAIQAARLEIVGSFCLDEKGTTVKSKVATWFGREWHFELRKDGRSEPPRVGMFFFRGPAIGKEVKAEVHKVSYTFYARIWPNGHWKLLFNGSISYGKYDAYGSIDAFSKTWDEARKCTQLNGCTGEISVKVVARLISDG